MLITIFFAVVSLWLLGIATEHTLGGLIHLLLLLALIVLLVEYLDRRNPRWPGR